MKHYLAILCATGIGTAAAVPPVTAYLVKDINTDPVTAGARPPHFRATDGKVYPATTDPAPGAERQVSDAAPSVTSVAYDPSTATASGVWPYGGSAVAIGDVLLFSHAREATAEPGVYRQALWRTDGTAAGTRALPRNVYDAGSVRAVRRFGAEAVFVSEQPGLIPRWRYYRTDRDFTATQPLAADAERRTLQPVGAAGALFSCSPAANARSLCAQRDGDAQATTLIPLLEDAAPMQPLGSLGDVAFFFSPPDGLAAQRGLWRSDGTAPGTFRLDPGLAPTMADRAVSQVYQGKLVFDACVAATRECGLYSSDGSSVGTGRIAVLSEPVRSFAVIGERLAFTASRSTYASQLWITDGSAAGTFPLAPIWYGHEMDLVSSGGLVHYIAETDATNGARYLVSDGTPAGTRDLPLPPGLNATTDVLTALDADHVVFSCSSAATGTELCLAAADGTNMRLLGDFNPGPESSGARLMGRTSEAAYFAIYDPLHGYEPWRVGRPGERIFTAGFDD